jgi:Cu-processing system permease protein
VFVLAEAGLVLLMTAALGGRSATLIAGVSAAFILGLTVAAWRSQKWLTFGPIPWAMALFVVGYFLASVAPVQRSLIVASSILTVLEVMIVAAVATLFSSFSTPFLSALLTIGMLVVGRSADSMAQLPKKFFGEDLHEAGKLLAKVIPNLQVYVPARPLLTGEALDADLPSYLLRAALMTLGWSLGLLAAASFVFQRRDFV